MVCGMIQHERMASNVVLAEKMTLFTGVFTLILVSTYKNQNTALKLITFLVF